jgi:hypothetical protein
MAWGRLSTFLTHVPKILWDLRFSWQKNIINQPGLCLKSIMLKKSSSFKSVGLCFWHCVY